MAKNEAAARIIDSLAFEVEAIPQDNILEVSGTSKSTPVNLKIKVRKKEEALFKQGVVSVPKLGQPKKAPEQIRLLNSDQTVLSFKVFVDTDPEKKPAKKRKRFFGGCLSSEDNDEDSYTESNNATKSGEVVKLNFGLSKNVQDMQLQTRKPTMFFGNTCKPGGCLDPPFGEDEYSYEPNENITDHKIPTENDMALTNKSSIVHSLDKTSYNDEMTNDEIKILALGAISGGINSKNSIQKRSFQSMGLGSETSFREISESHFSLKQSIAEKTPLLSEHILEEQTPDNEKILTKLYPEEKDSTFQSKTNSSMQDLKENEESKSLATTVLAAGGALSGGALLIAGATELLTKSREDTTNETGLNTPINMKENIKILRSGDDNPSTTGTSKHSEKEEVLNSSTNQSDVACVISRTKEYDEDNIQITPDDTLKDYETLDQNFLSSGDENNMQNEKNASINNLSGANEISKKEETDVKSKTSYDGNLIQESNISHDIFQPNVDVQDLIKDDIKSENITVAESQDQHVDDLAIYVNSGDNEKQDQVLNKTSDGVYIQNILDNFDKENENILLTSEQSKSSLQDDKQDTDKINNVDFQQKEDPNKLSNLEIENASNSSQDDRNLKVDFIDDSIKDMNDDITKLKDKDLTTDSVLSSQDIDIIKFKEKDLTTDSILSSRDNDIAKLKSKDQTTDSILTSRDGSKFRLKKDFINMNLAFQSYMNDQNESVIKSIDTIKDIKRQPQDNVTIIKSQLKINTPNVIKVPIDTRNYMMLEVKASNHQISPDASSRALSPDALSPAPKETISKRSNNKVKCPKAPSQHSQKNEMEKFQNLLSTVYDQQLIPLQRLISDLKKDVDVLATEQLWLKENCRRMKKSSTKLTHSSRKCGCSRK